MYDNYTTRFEKTYLRQQPSNMLMVVGGGTLRQTSQALTVFIFNQPI